MLDLGRAYADGRCGLPDPVSSIEWLKKAACEGLRSDNKKERRIAVEAMARLWQMVERGDAAPPDPYAASELWKCAHAVDPEYAEEIFKKLQTDHPSEALARSFWHQRQRHALGVFAGEAAWPADPRDCASAYSQSLKAAQGGNPDAQYRLGAMLFEGRCVPAGRTAGAKWLEKAASGGNAAAQLAMGAILQKDLLASPGRLEKLGSARDPVLTCRLGAAYRERGPWAVDQCASARTYLEMAAAQAQAPIPQTLAMIRLGSMHAAAREHGKALEWYLKAAARGSAAAQFNAAMILR